jgi:hypothetical protein
MAKQTPQPEPEPEQQSPTKPYRVLRNVLGTNHESKGNRFHLPFKLFRPGSTIELTDEEAAQQIKIGHVELIK